MTKKEIVVIHPMQVRHFSTFPHGGAGNAAIGIHRSLQKQGIESRFCYLNNDADLNLDSSFYPMQSLENHQQQQEKTALNWLRPFLERRTEKRRTKKIIQQHQAHLDGNTQQTEVFSQSELVAPIRVDFSKVGSEIIHLHWTAFSVDWPSFFGSIPRSTPIVWTLHDQNPYTGGCHYTTGCEEFTRRCGNCPQIRNPSENDLSRYTLRLKAKVLAGRRLHITAPSQWMLEQAKKSPVFSSAKSFTHIPYGIDATQFDSSMTSKMSMTGRRILPTILLGAEDLQNTRKGIVYAIDAVNKTVAILAQQQHDAAVVLQLWTFGKALDSAMLAKLDKRISITQWGYLSDRSIQGQLYRSANLFLLSSLEDNQPQTALESMACGTPVIGFDVGGVPEIIRHNQSGLVVAAKDTTAMANAAVKILLDPQLARRFSLQGKRIVESEFTIPKQAQQYEKLYRSIVDPQFPQRHRPNKPHVEVGLANVHSNSVSTKLAMKDSAPHTTASRRVG